MKFHVDALHSFKIIELGDGKNDLHTHDWQVNTIIQLVRHDAIFGGLSIGR